MWNQAVKEKQEQDADQKTGYCWEEAELSHASFGRQIHCGNQQRPDGCGHHYPGRKSEQSLLQKRMDFVFHKKHHSCAEGSSDKWDGNPCNCIKI